MEKSICITLMIVVVFAVVHNTQGGNVPGDCDVSAIGCSVCDNVGSVVCTECENSTFYFNASAYTCPTCSSAMPDCEMCGSATNCTSCSSSYEVNANSTGCDLITVPTNTSTTVPTNTSTTTSATNELTTAAGSGTKARPAIQMAIMLLILSIIFHG